MGGVCTEKFSTIINLNVLRLGCVCFFAANGGSDPAFSGKYINLLVACLSREDNWK